jgi:hypothetical protein
MNFYACLQVYPQFLRPWDVCSSKYEISMAWNCIGASFTKHFWRCALPRITFVTHIFRISAAASPIETLSLSKPVYWAFKWQIKFTQGWAKKLIFEKLLLDMVYYLEQGMMHMLYISSILINSKWYIWPRAKKIEFQLKLLLLRYCLQKNL